MSNCGRNLTEASILHLAMCESVDSDISRLLRVTLSQFKPWMKCRSTDRDTRLIVLGCEARLTCREMVQKVSEVCPFCARVYGRRSPKPSLFTESS